MTSLAYDFIDALPVVRDTQNKIDRRERVRKDRPSWRDEHRIEKRSRTSLDRGIVAIDGEGQENENGKHVYNLLAHVTDTGDTGFIENHSNNPKAFFDYLLSVGDLQKLNVIFSGDYDVTMLLKYMPKPFLERLKKTHRARWGKYRFTYVRRKEFIIRLGKRIFHLYDVFGFFQCSFIKAVDNFQVGTLAERELVRAMKERRADFANIEMDKRIEYCLLENRLLVEIMRILVKAMADADIKLVRWDGAGAIAAAILRREHIKEFMDPDPIGEYETDAIMRAYFGGRSELAIGGLIENAYGYDIRSAYPSIMRSLPCLAHLDRELVSSYDPRTLAVWHVEWSIPLDSRWGPFPWRDAKGNVKYPACGEGWYWSSEVAIAMKHFPDMITVIEGFTYTRQCSDLPFDFINHLFDYRNQLKSEGNWAQYPIKLGLNSLYGKTAQGVGWEGATPPYRSYIWAGLITSGTRAVLLDAIMQAPEHIVTVATDGIVSRVPLNLTIGSRLGEWEETEYETCFYIRPGIARLREKGKDKDTYKTRGFGVKEVDPERLFGTFYHIGPLAHYKYTVRRFVGFTAALHLTDYRAKLGEWVEQARVVNFLPIQRGMNGYRPGSWRKGNVAYYSIPAKCDSISAAFIPKGDRLLTKANELSNEIIDLDQP